MTPAEAKLWSYLQLHQVGGIRLRRQHAIGPYVVDFCAPREKLIIEVDGQPHRRGAEEDAARAAFLRADGYRILRFWDAQVMRDSESVVRKILSFLADEGRAEAPLTRRLRHA